MTSTLGTEFQYYLDQQKELVDRYDGKCVVIKSRRVIGVYDDELTAVMETRKTEKLGTFLVQKVSPGVEAYTQVLHSRVAFE